MRIKQQPGDFRVKERIDLRMESKGEYAYYELTKKGMTLRTALSKVSRAFRIRESHINYAGIKDKEAITTQMISIRDGPERDLKGEDFSLTFKGKGRERINIGALEGNAFSIVLRDLDSRPAPPDRFINTFGEQRFGMNRNNHDIGRCIVKGDFKTAALKMADQHPEVKEYLAVHPEDVIGAIREVDKKIGLLYLHAYQSFLWNEAAIQLAKKSNEPMDVPLVGFGTDFDDEVIRKVYTPILKREELKLHDFIIRKMPEFSVEGSLRPLYMLPSSLRIGQLEEDELNRGRKKVQVDFSLPSGSYATEIIAQMTWE